MTILFWYLGGLFIGILFNYALHQPNKEIEKRLAELEKNLNIDSEVK